MDMRAVEIAGVFAIAIGTLFLMSLVATFPTLWLWNWLMPELFGVKAVTFWQALGINLLAGLLLKPATGSSK
jgi:hypothetical protein